MLVQEGTRDKCDLLFYRVDDGQILAQCATVYLVAVVVTTC